MKFLRLLLIALSFCSMLSISFPAHGEEDEFEPVSKSENISAKMPITNETAAPVKDVVAEPSQDAQSLHSLHSLHEASLKSEIVWLNLILLLLGVVTFFIRKYYLRYVLLLISVAVLGFYHGGCPCPVGAATRIFFDWWSSQSVALTALLLGMVLIPTAIFGRFFCGSACPLGALQDFLAVRSKLVHVPFKVERRLRYGQYLFFVFLLVASWLSSRYYFETIDPFRTIFNVKGNALQFSIAGVLLLTSLFVYRPFCRYLCPLAVLMNLVGFISPFKIRKPATCNSCSLCAKRCPMSVIDANYEVDDRHCIRCGDCMDLCKPKFYRFTFRTRKDLKNEKI